LQLVGSQKLFSVHAYPKKSGFSLTPSPTAEVQLKIFHPLSHIFQVDLNERKQNILKKSCSSKKGRLIFTHLILIFSETSKEKVMLETLS
jgi:hypothetical protein